MTHLRLPNSLLAAAVLLPLVRLQSRQERHDRHQSGRRCSGDRDRRIGFFEKSLGCAPSQFQVGRQARCHAERWRR